MPKPMRGSGRHPPSVILEQHSTVSSSDSGVAAALAPAPVYDPMLGKNPAALVQTLGANIPPPAGTVLGSSPPPPVGFHTPNPAAHAVAASALHTGDPSGAHAASPSPSPVPALEAILLDRKRRLAAASGGAGSMAGSVRPSSSSSTVASMSASHSKEGVVPILPGSPKSVHGTSAKGTRFKSSPLGGAERAGVVVAEQIKAASDLKEGGELDEHHQ